MKKAKLGIIGFSDGDREVHDQLKEIVQAQVDIIQAELEKSGKVDVVVADEWSTVRKRPRESPRT
jgi:L-fucose isomerase